MPFYEYECSNCKFYVEALQKITDEPLRKCPSCKKPALKKLVSAPVFRLKGGGWYETDFKSDGENKRNIAGREDGEAKEAKEEPKKEGAEAADKKAADTKPETKAEAKAEAKEAKSAAKAKPAAKASSKAKAKASRPARKAPARKK